VLRNRSILALVTAELISRLGSQFTWLALPWFVLVTTGSSSKMALVFAAEIAPMAVLGIPAGAVVQRLGPKTSMLIADAARAPLIAAVPLLHSLGHLSYGLILVIAAASGAFSCAYFACQRAILPAIVGEDETLLAQGTSLIEGATNVTQLAGPAMAGVLIAVLGAANVMWLDAASFAIAFVLVGLFVQAAREVHDETEAGGMLAGLAYLKRDALVLRVSISSLVFGFLFPMLAVSFPVLAFEQYDQHAWVAGVLLATIGAGQVVGSLLAYRLVARVRPLLLAACAALLTGPPLWLLVPHLPLWLVAVTLAVVGASVPLINAPYIAMLQTRVPKALRTKVLQSLITINQVAGPLGFVVAGTLIASIGLHPVYALIAGLATFASLNFVFAVLPELGRLEPQEAA
jgi:MFS family permease